MCVFTMKNKVNVEKNRNEIRPITGLRAIAAFGVYCTHFGLPGPSPSWLTNIPPNGGLGVPFFFVLSGFVLAIAYEDRPLIPLKFAIDRFARIGPTYYLAFFIAVIYQTAIIGPKSDYVFIVHLFALQSWFPTMDSGVSFNGPAWTISVEIFLYALFPLLLSLTSNRKSIFSKWWIIFLGGNLLSLIPFGIHLYNLGPLIGLHNTQVWTYFLPTHYLGLFVVGISGCRARSDISRIFTKKKIGPILCDCSILLFAVILLKINFKDPNHPLFSKSAQFWLIGLPTVWILVLVSVNSTTSHFAKLFGSAPFWLAGKISMVFYLIHVPIVWCISRVYPDTSYGIKLASTVILSLVIHFAIEVPSNLFIRRRFDLYQKKLINKP